MKKIIALVLSFYLFILGLTPAFASYNPNKPHTRWYYDSLINDPTVKSTVEVKAQKTYPVSTLDQNGKPIKQMRNAKSTVKVAANVNKVGKTIFKRSPAAAITMAMTNLLGRAVDWVLDPENNRVKYKDKGDSDNPQYLYRTNSSYNLYKSPLLACENYYENKSYELVGATETACRVKLSSGKVVSGEGLLKVKNPDYEEGKPIDWQYEHIDAVANQMIADATDGQAPAMQVMTDTALDAVEAGELDSDLDAASDIPQPDPEQITQEQYDDPNYPAPETPTDPDGDTGGETPNPDPESPNPEPTPTEWPAFCDWATTVCDWIEWSKEEPDPPEDTTVFVEDPVDFDTDKSYITFTGSCPPPYTASLNVMGNTVPFSFDYAPICSVMSSLAPFIKGAGYLTAAYIIAGFSRGANG